LSESEVKKCPECGEEMERGYLPVGMRGLQWSSKKHKWFADSLWQESVESLTGDTFRAFMGNVPAYLCRECKLVLVFYENETRAIRKMPKSFLKKCVGCAELIPIASEYCPKCGTKQSE
jgi:predicted RNA-binding Zn-ribbon protein involved in translation (DUF1610 family)